MLAAAAGLPTMVDLLVLDRRDQTHLAVHAPVVEPVDVLRDRDLQVLDRRERVPVPDRLGCEQRVERFSEDLVMPVPSRPAEATAPATANRWVYRTATYGTALSAVMT